jgi:hypothetical protein
MPTTSLSTTLLESVNIVLANLGESPVNSLSGGALPQQVSLALNTIEEVSTDIQSKGWWFNQQTGSNYDTTANVVIYPSNTTNEWSSDIPEEARRYITIRASRIAQTRLIGSEELQKFSYNEELVSLAILQQAHVRNSNGTLDFNSFPAELRGLGMDEVMFLQGNVEEKIGTLRLGGELANIAKTKAETALIADQEELVAKQTLTEVQNALKVVAETSLLGEQEDLVEAQALDVAADTTLKGKQGSLVDAQATDVAADTSLKGAQEDLVEAQTTDVAADTTLKGKQGSLVDAQATDVAADTSLKGAQEDLVEAQTTDVAADTTLKGKQGSLVDAQATDVAADTTLKGKQGSLVDAQATDVAADTSLKGVQEDLLESQITDVAADTALKTSQKTQLDAQTAIEATAEKDFYDGVVAGTQATYRDFAAEMRMMGIQESGINVRGEIPFQQTPAYKKVEMLKDAAKLRLVTATETGTDATELREVNKVMRFIGEPPVTALNDNSLASECVRLIRDTDTELQGRGWWFNIEEDVELTPNGSGQIIINNTMLSVEAYDYDTRMEFGGYLYDLNKKSADNWTSSIKAKVIYKRTLSYTPQKYREYLSVRVAILLTELYPQSGVDIQRLPKMEAELRAYFKDREFDDANYSIFDNYDVASRIGINRNYDLT